MIMKSFHYIYCGFNCITIKLFECLLCIVMNNDAKLSDKKSIDFRTTRGKRIFSGSCVRYPSQDKSLLFIYGYNSLKKGKLYMLG